MNTPCFVVKPKRKSTLPLGVFDFLFDLTTRFVKVTVKKQLADFGIVIN
jgi:hypothetical protein